MAKPTDQKQQLDQVFRMSKNLDRIMINDRHAVRQQCKRLISAANKRGIDARKFQRLTDQYQESYEQYQHRLNNVPKPVFNSDLPVMQYKDEIVDCIRQHPVTVIAGETGSGKTTQLPQLCLSMGRGIAGYIGHTQPRRIAARSVATRIAEELNCELGTAVGYKVRFTGNVSPHSYIKMMTDGILLAEMQGDSFLNQYDTIILDEAHERNLNIDFLLGYLKRLLPRRPDLKLIITSATIDTERFSRHFDNAPIIEVSGRTYPVEVRYRPLEDVEDNEEQSGKLPVAILNAIRELDSTAGRGDILVFLSGERDIKDTSKLLTKQLQHSNTEILQLYSRLSAAEQNRVFHSGKSRRVILATNVAETSLTVPGIRYVIDSGLARINRYNYRNKVQRLPIEKISQSNANQRKGRCGRMSDGVCIRLYSEADFDTRPVYMDPEIKRVNLASVILRMKSLHLGRVEEFPFIDQPDERYVKDGYKLLNELSALDHQHKLTAIGRQLSRMPIDPKLGRMLLEAGKRHALKELLVICSALSIQDPRERPQDYQNAADEKHARFEDEQSDFIFYINLWQAFKKESRESSNTRMRKWCKEHFLSFQRMREWIDVHGQLKEIIAEFGLKVNQQPANYEDIHCCLLSGLLGNICLRKEKTEYTGARNINLFLFPGSGLMKQPPKWLVAADLIETTRLYASTVAKISPEWLEKLAAHLTKHHYSEPHWDRHGNRVMAYEKITLYGLPIAVNKRINYEKIAPIESRDIFIKSAIVGQDMDCDAYFFTHNIKLIDEIREIEDRQRRKGILISEDKLFHLYDQKIPSEVRNAREFKQWITNQEQIDRQYLCFTREQLVEDQSLLEEDQGRPASLVIGDKSFQLEYAFDIDAHHDGVSVMIPALLINQVPDYTFEWLVPGMLQEKIVAIIKSLPKRYRRNFVPAPEYAKACADSMTPCQQPLLESVARALQKMTGVTVPENIWEEIDVPLYLKMNFKIIDNAGVVLKQGRDLNILRQQVATSGKTRLLNTMVEQEHCLQWSFGDLPVSKKIDVKGYQLSVYPAVMDKKDSVALQLFESQDEADKQHRKGVVRLYRLTESKKINYVEKNLSHLQKICLNLHDRVPCEKIKSDIMCHLLEMELLGAGVSIRSEASFKERVAHANASLMESANQITKILLDASERYKNIKSRIKGHTHLSWMAALADIQSHLDALIYPGFIADTPPEWLKHVPRYLQGIEARLKKLEQSPQKDQQRLQQLTTLWNRYLELKADPVISVKQEKELQQYHWMLQEMRISLFAQELGTAIPVSINRLTEHVSAFKKS